MLFGCLPFIAGKLPWALSGKSHRISLMTWRELITDIYVGRSQQPGIAAKPEFYAAAPAATILEAESTLHAALPGSLRTLLLETNGVMDLMAIDGGDWFESMWLLWKIEEVIEQNAYYRAASKMGTCERDFSGLVFFADAGTDGVLFAFPVVEGVCDSRVVVWRPIMDVLDDLAPSLQEFLRGWLTGTITI